MSVQPDFCPIGKFWYKEETGLFSQPFFYLYYSPWFLQNNVICASKESGGSYLSFDTLEDPVTYISYSINFEYDHDTLVLNGEYPELQAFWYSYDDGGTYVYAQISIFYLSGNTYRLMVRNDQYGYSTYFDYDISGSGTLNIPVTIQFNYYSATVTIDGNFAATLDVAFPFSNYVNFYGSSGAVSDPSNVIGLKDLYFVSDYMPYPCVPPITYHEVAPDSTVKMSHVRRIRGERSAQAAELVAEAMRRRYL